MYDWLYQIGQQALEAVNQIGQQALEGVNQSSPPVLIALFIVTFLTEFAIPFPWVQDVIYYYIGFQFGRSSLRAIPITLVMLAGRLAGSAVVYWLARLIGTPLINWVGKRFKKFPSRVAAVQARLAKHPVVAMTSVRLMPGMLVPSSIAAGAICLRYTDFMLGIVFASLIDDGTTVISGFLTRLSIDYLGVKPTPWLFGVGVIVTMVMVWFIPWIVFRRKPPKKAAVEAKKEADVEKSDIKE